MKLRFLKRPQPFFGQQSQSVGGESVVPPPEVGDFDVNRGMYLGKWAGVHAYAADTLLYGKAGAPVIATFNQAQKELGCRKGGGTEAAIRQAISENTFQDGIVVLPPKELLHGRDVHGNETRPEANIYALMKSGKLPKIADVVRKLPVEQEWALSCSEPYNKDAAVVYLMNMGAGNGGWHVKDFNRAVIIPVKLYRRQGVIQSAVRTAPIL